MTTKMERLSKSKSSCVPPAAATSRSNVYVAGSVGASILRNMLLAVCLLLLLFVGMCVGETNKDRDYEAGQVEILTHAYTHTHTQGGNNRKLYSELSKVQKEEEERNNKEERTTTHRLLQGAVVGEGGGSVAGTCSNVSDSFRSTVIIAYEGNRSLLTDEQGNLLASIFADVYNGLTTSTEEEQQEQSKLCDPYFRSITEVQVLTNITFAGFNNYGDEDTLDTSLLMIPVRRLEDYIIKIDDDKKQHQHQHQEASFRRLLRNSLRHQYSRPIVVDSLDDYNNNEADENEENEKNGNGNLKTGNTRRQTLHGLLRKSFQNPSPHRQLQDSGVGQPSPTTTRQNTTTTGGLNRTVARNFDIGLILLDIVGACRGCQADGLTFQLFDDITTDAAGARQRQRQRQLQEQQEQEPFGGRDLQTVDDCTCPVDSVLIESDTFQTSFVEEVVARQEDGELEFVEGSVGDVIPVLDRPCPKEDEEFTTVFILTDLEFNSNLLFSLGDIGIKTVEKLFRSSFNGIAQQVCDPKFRTVSRAQFVSIIRTTTDSRLVQFEFVVDATCRGNGCTDPGCLFEDANDGCLGGGEGGRRRQLDQEEGQELATKKMTPQDKEDTAASIFPLVNSHDTASTIRSGSLGLQNTQRDTSSSSSSTRLLEDDEETTRCFCRAGRSVRPPTLPELKYAFQQGLYKITQDNKLGSCQQCFLGSECKSGICLDGQCAEQDTELLLDGCTCNTNETCASGYCQVDLSAPPEGFSETSSPQGVCTTRLENCEVCTIGFDCSTGICLTGRCANTTGLLEYGCPCLTYESCETQRCDILGTGNCARKLMACATCNVGLDCLSGQCTAGICGDALDGKIKTGCQCTSNENCKSGRCSYDLVTFGGVAGQCIEKISDTCTEPCLTPNDCASGSCGTVVCLPTNGTLLQEGCFSTLGSEECESTRSEDGVCVPDVSMARSVEPSHAPSSQPSQTPSQSPSIDPSVSPSQLPSFQPSKGPSTSPSGSPSKVPSVSPSMVPSEIPTTKPSTQPSTRPSVQPSARPSEQPTTKPSTQPSADPSAHPSEQPTTKPSTHPSANPSAQPSERPTAMPSSLPSSNPSTQPTPLDECSTGVDNCSENALCTDIPGGYTCECIAGFTGDGETCADIDECALETVDCDFSFGTCTNTPGSYDCDCLSGYTFSGNGFECEDINECSSEPCNSLASCTNIMGGFLCECNDGYTGDGFTCDDVNECDNSGSCDTNASCTNTIGSFTCECNEGLQGTGFPGDCFDINECAEGTDDCNVNADCSNFPGGYSCSCKQGYEGNGLDTCTDINECQLGTDNCHANADCTNLPGGFSCSCATGYLGNGVTSCSDINECLSENPCNTNELCENTAGSYTCTSLCKTSQSLSVIHDFCNEQSEPNKCCVSDGAVGAGACDDLPLGKTLTVCRDSCIGVGACTNLSVSGQTSTLEIGSGSCKGANACSNLGSGSIDADACVGTNACRNLGSTVTESVTIKAGACDGDGACYIDSTGDNEPQTAKAVTIGLSSCVGENACLQLGKFGSLTVTIGDTSCTGSSSCSYVGMGSEGSGPGIISIGESACDGVSACFEAGDSSSSVSIGNFACTSDNACNGCDNTGSPFAIGSFTSTCPYD